MSMLDVNRTYMCTHTHTAESATHHAQNSPRYKAVLILIKT